MSFIKHALIASVAVCVVATANGKDLITSPVSKQKQAQVSPSYVLSMLKKGNKRFVDDAEHRYNYVSIREHNRKGQHPLAIVLSCVDSRSIPDVLFDQTPGNLFVARIAGNVVSPDVLGSMEFATKYAGSKLVVVMGHTSCGAVQGACKGFGEDNLKVLLSSLQPAVDNFKKDNKSKAVCESVENLDAIAKENVHLQLSHIIRDSATLRKLVIQKKIMLVGAMHDLATGKVTFFDGNEYQNEKKKIR